MDAEKLDCWRNWNRRELASEAARQPRVTNPPHVHGATEPRRAEITWNDFDFLSVAPRLRETSQK